jgi:MFS family permease
VYVKSRRGDESPRALLVGGRDLKTSDVVSGAASTAVIAWLITAVYYFHQYTLRSAPAVMMPQLSEAFGMTSAAVASLLGLFYWGYAPFGLVAGPAMDRLGPRKIVPVGAALVGVGALLFATGEPALAGVGRFLQGVGGVFAFVGAVFIATTSFPASRAATLIGATQMFGMAGGSAGQFVVGPLIAAGTPWSVFWSVMGIAALVIGGALLMLLPSPAAAARQGNWLQDAGRAIAAVLLNPQSILCGVVAGLLFIPTTIFDMVWGVRFLEEAHGVDYGSAVLRSATVPLGWVIGCPLLGWMSDRIGRRKPVIVGGGVVLGLSLAWILFGTPGVLPPYVLGLIAGIASGAAMLPYTVIKETNPPQYGGTATGALHFINFSMTALLGPIFGRRLMAAAESAQSVSLEHYQSAFAPMLLGVALAIGLTFLLKETGPAMARQS